MKYHKSTTLGSEEISHRKNSGPQVQPRTVPAPWLVGPVPRNEIWKNLLLSCSSMVRKRNPYTCL